MAKDKVEIVDNFEVPKEPETTTFYGTKEDAEEMDEILKQESEKDDSGKLNKPGDTIQKQSSPT